MSKPTLAAIIIAAGNSSRLGFAKQSIELNGSTLLEWSLERVKGLVDYSVCVLGFDAIKFHSDTLPADECLVNKDWSIGMGSSIACGVKHLEQCSTDYDGVLVCLCDQWLLTTADVSSLVDQWYQEPEKIVASHYFEPKLQQTISGAPAIFPRTLFPQLVELNEQGARNLIKKNKNMLINLNIKNAAFDIDTPEDYEYFQSFQSSQKPSIPTEI